MSVPLSSLERSGQLKSEVLRKKVLSRKSAEW
jgi:hypothetical protein